MCQALQIKVSTDFRTLRIKIFQSQRKVTTKIRSCIVMSLVILDKRFITISTMPASAVNNHIHYNPQFRAGHRDLIVIFNTVGSRCPVEIIPKYDMQQLFVTVLILHGK